jgi:hypothetical protein
MDKVKFTAMKDGDREDYEFLTEHEIEYASKTAERLLGAMVELDAEPVGLPGHTAWAFAAVGHPCLARWRRYRLGGLGPAA